MSRNVCVCVFMPGNCLQGFPTALEIGMQFNMSVCLEMGHPGGSGVKNPPASAGYTNQIPGLGRFPKAGNDNPSHGQRSLAGCGPQGHKELDMTEKLSMSLLRYIISGLKKVQVKQYPLTSYVKNFSTMLILFSRTAIHQVVFSSYIPWFYQSFRDSKVIVYKISLLF